MWESIIEEFIDLGLGDGEFIINCDGVKLIVIDDVFIEKELKYVISLFYVENEILDMEGSGEGFLISVFFEEEYELID